MGQIFAMANPEAAVRILWEIFPQTKPTGIDEVTALTNEVKASSDGAKASASTIKRTTIGCSSRT
jgi:NitT/TauT family transport system substrate-binding protein